MAHVILHVDANCFYASVELLSRPDLRGKPVAVCGSEEARHGIVLAKSQRAKEAGVQTAEPIWQARRKCPDLVVLPPHFDRYVAMSRALRDIYGQYTDRVEPYGLDEAWLDVSAPDMDFDRAERLADAIRLRTRAEIGLTVSVGVSFTKPLSKLGSDLKKPDGTTVLSPDNFRARVWPLPVDALLFVGKRTREQLARLGIETVGALANAQERTLCEHLGKNGALLKSFALGLDAPFASPEHVEEKSVGNGLTPPRDVETTDDFYCLNFLLAHSVAQRLRAQGMRAGCVRLALRGPDLRWHGVQTVLRPATDLTGEIAQAAARLFAAHGSLPLRSLSLTCTALVPACAPEQLGLFAPDARRARAQKIDEMVDSLCKKFGGQPVRRAVELSDAQFASLFPGHDADHFQPFHAV